MGYKNYKNSTSNLDISIWNYTKSFGTMTSVYKIPIIWNKYEQGL